MSIEETRARRVLSTLVAMVATLVLGTPTARAQARYVSVDANPSSLGVIPAATGGSCSTRVVTFDVAGIDVVREVRVTLEMSFSRVGAHGAVLISPSGRGFALFTVLGPTAYPNPVNGRYGFGDLSAVSWLTRAPSDPTLPIPEGAYGTLNGTTQTSINEAFVGERGNGRWSLTFLNCYSPTAGQVTEAYLSVDGHSGVVTSAVASTLGAIPDGPSSTPQSAGSPRIVRFDVPAGRGAVTRVSVRMTMTHPFVGDLSVRLFAPASRAHTIFGYTGAVTGASVGSSYDLDGSYRFGDAAPRGWWNAATFGGNGVVPSGLYQTSEHGGVGANGHNTLIDPVFAGLPSSGTWTLSISDGRRGDVGSISSAELTIETAPVRPVGRDDAYATTYLTPLTVAAPGVLANDDARGAGVMYSALLTPPANGALDLQPSGAFTYMPRPGFAGTDSFQYRPLTVVDYGPAVTVTITVSPPMTVQAPLDLEATSIAGQEVTLRWKTAPGPMPSGFVLEGGIAPGQPIAAIGTGPLPVLSFQAPRGVFFVRVRAISGGVTSAPSPEIRIVVGVPEVPSAPTQLAGVVHGDAFGLSWRNTFAGGEPSDLQLVVSGSHTAIVPLPLGESLSLAGVPAGTYTFSVRARNSTGVGAESTGVTLTLPGACSGPPLVPQNLLVFAVGNMVHAYWDPPASGSATTNYVLHVTGSFSGSVPMAARQLHVPAPPGSYAIAVAAQNACGASAPTSPQSAFVH